MIYQTKYIALLFFLSVLLMGSRAKASLYDVENNNARANQTGVLYGANAIIKINGNLSQTDIVDTYSIRNLGGNDGIMQWTFFGNSNLQTMYVYEDINKNKKYDRFDKYLFNIKHFGAKNISSSIGTHYLVRFSQKSQAKAMTYSMKVVAFKTVKLNVISVKSLGKFDNGNNKPDFYVKTKVNNGLFRKSRVFPNNDKPVFNHFHQEIAVPIRGYVPFEIQIWDSDGRNKDDQADINPTPRIRKLSLRLDLYKKQVQMKNGKVLGPIGRAITVKGDRLGDSAAVTFTVY